MIDREIGAVLEKYLDKVITHYHYRHESIYKDIAKPRIKGVETGRKSIMAYNLMTVCKEWNVNGLNALLEEYTMEQIWWMMDAITFSSYEVTKEGRSANNKLFQKKWSEDKEVLAKIDQIEKQMAFLANR